MSAGTIGGKAFRERPGSPEIRFSEDDASAVRTLIVDWADVWTIIKELTKRPTSAVRTVTDDRDFPTWPTEFLAASSNLGGGRLIVKDINVVPDQDGRQPGITTDSANSDIATYTYARMTITYGFEQDRYADATWSSILNTKAIKGDDFTWQSDGQALTDLSVPVGFPSQEFTKLQRSSDIDPADPNGPSIRDLTNAMESLGTINSQPIFFAFGDTIHKFLTHQVLLTSWEVVPNFRFGEWQNDIMYRFKIAPAAMSFVISGGVKTWPRVENGLAGTWDYIWSQPDNLYRLVDETIYYNSDHNKLFS